MPYLLNNNVRDHRSANLLRIIDQYPTFGDAQLLPVLRAVIGEWENDVPANRPGFECLNKVWLRGRRPHGQGSFAVVPKPEHVAAVLSLLIIDGGIDPFEGLTAETAREHLLTSKHEPSDRLRQLLQGNQLMVEGGREGVSTFVRAIALGFGWRDYLPTGTALRVLVDTATPADLLAGYHIASSLAFDRGYGVHSSDTNFQAIAEGIVESLKQRLRAGALQGREAQFASRVIRIIELGRVVRGMVHLLAPGAHISAVDGSMLEGWFDPQRTVDGPLSHLRSYALLGAPLIDLVGHAVDGEVRRGIERIMEAGARNIPGYPTDARLSHRPSDLLRRIRFLVRAMVLRSRDPGAHPIFMQFVHGLFAGADQNLVLSAARFAFQRPGPGVAAMQMRSDLHNLLSQAGIFDGGATEPSEDCLHALRVIVSIEVDTWTADAQPGDGSAPEVLEAVVEELRSLREQLKLEGGDLVDRVFDPYLLARVMEELRRVESGTNLRRKFFRSLKDSEDVLKTAMNEGVPAFAKLIKAHYHREFEGDFDGRTDLSRLRRLRVDDEGCMGFLSTWASLNSGESDSDSEVQGWTAEEWTSRVRAEPLVRGGPVSAPWIFRAADAAARGDLAALAALRTLAEEDNARQLYQMAGSDAVGRTLGVVIAQTCCAELVERLFGRHRGYELPLTASVDGVTPLMAAARFAKEGAPDRQRGFECVLRCFLERGGDLGARDGRGWRAIHHAFAAGHVEAARMLVAHDAHTPYVQAGDSTTFLIEALRRTGRRHYEGASLMGFAHELLSGMTPEQIAKTLSFQGPKMIEGAEGMPLSVVSASVGADGNWAELMALVQTYPTQTAGIWSQAGAKALYQLARRPDHLQLAQFLGCVGAAGGQHLQQIVGALPEPLTLAVSADAGHPSTIDSALMKLVHLRQFGVLDISAEAPEGGSMLHKLVSSASEARSSKRPTPDAKLYDFAATVLEWVAPVDASRVVLHRDFDGESSIWQAVRWGEWALALAYARKLGPADAARVRTAAKFVTMPSDYQGGVDNGTRIETQGGRLSMVLHESGDRFALSDNELPADLDSGSAQKWLRENATTIAQRLRAKIGTQLNVGADEFINLIAHLVDGEDDVTM